MAPKVVVPDLQALFDGHDQSRADLVLQLERLFGDEPLEDVRMGLAATFMDYLDFERQSTNLMRAMLTVLIKKSDAGIPIGSRDEESK